MNRILAALLLAGAAMLGTATPAQAHTRLIASNPAEGAALPAAPTEVRLTFDGPVQVQLSTVTVTGPDGVQWTVGNPVVPTPC